MLVAEEIQLVQPMSLLVQQPAAAVVHLIHELAAVQLAADELVDVVQLAAAELAVAVVLLVVPVVQKQNFLL